jgi:hypothetical protein
MESRDVCAASLSLLLSCSSWERVCGTVCGCVWVCVRFCLTAPEHVSVLESLVKCPVSSVPAVSSQPWRPAHPWRPRLVWGPVERIRGRKGAHGSVPEPDTLYPVTMCDYIDEILAVRTGDTYAFSLSTNPHAAHVISPIQTPAHIRSIGFPEYKNGESQ